MTCDRPHPDDPRVTCDKDTPCYGYHANATEQMVWPGDPLPQTTTAKTTKGALALIAQRAARSAR